MTPDQAASQIWDTWWARMHAIFKPALDFYEQHLPATYAGLSENALSNPSRFQRAAQGAKSQLVSIYKQTGGLDANGQPMPPPEEWPHLAPWFYRFASYYDLNKDTLTQYLYKSFGLTPPDEGVGRSRTRMDPLALPKAQEPAAFGPQPALAWVERRCKFATASPPSP